MDLRPIALAIGEELGGIIGYECIAPAVWEIDAAAGRITIHDPAAYELPEGAAWHGLSFEGQRPCLEGRLEENPAGRFVIDTGANNAVIVHAPTVQRFKLLEGRKTTDARFGGVGGIRSTPKGTLSSVTLAGQRVADVEAIFAQEGEGALTDDDLQAAVGLEVLSRFRLVIDYTNKRAALLPLKETD